MKHNSIQKKDHRALAYLVGAVACGGRAFLGVPAEVTAADVSLSVLWAVSLLLLALDRRKAWYAAPPLCMVALELYLCGTEGAGTLLWALARVADLALLAACPALLLRSARDTMKNDGYTRQGKYMLVMQGVFLAALTVLLPVCTMNPGQAAAATARSAAFLLYSIAQLWFVVLAVRAYNRARGENSGR